MIVLDPKKTTGKQLHKIVTDAVRDRKKETGKNVTKQDFLRESTLSRTMLNNYRHGAKPEYEGLCKVAAGLNAWGFVAQVKVA